MNEDVLFDALNRGTAAIYELTNEIIQLRQALGQAHAALEHALFLSKDPETV